METTDLQKRKAYNTLFNGITDSLNLVEQAKTQLVQAQQEAEKTFIDLPEIKGEDSQ